MEPRLQIYCVNTSLTRARGLVLASRPCPLTPLHPHPSPSSRSALGPLCLPPAIESPEDLSKMPVPTLLVCLAPTGLPANLVLGVVGSVTHRPHLCAQLNLMALLLSLVSPESKGFPGNYSHFRISPSTEDTLVPFPSLLLSHNIYRQRHENARALVSLFSFSFCSWHALLCEALQAAGLRFVHSSTVYTSAELFLRWMDLEESHTVLLVS